MSVWGRVTAGTILLLGLAVAVLLPNGYTCGTLEPVEVGRQWSYFQERWFYGCDPTRELAEAMEREEHPLLWRSMGADVDWRIPWRIGAMVVALLLAWPLLANNQRLMHLEGEPRSRLSVTAARSPTLVLLYALFGATIAVLLTLREDSFCLLHGRGPGSLTCTYRSFLGWNTEPIIAEALYAMVGVAAGTGLGLVLARLLRLYETFNLKAGRDPVRGDS